MAIKMRSSLVLLLLSFMFFPSALAVYNIVAYGAKSDGQTDSRVSLLKVWAAACSYATPSTIYVPAGTFAVGQVRFSGPCKNNKITIQIDGTLVAALDYTKYGVKGDWIVFDHVEGVSIIGGTIDGRGTALWACKAAGRSCPFGATSLTFMNSKNIVINGLASMNSELYHVDINGCQGVTVQGLKVTAPGNSPNTDGLHVQQSTGVTVTGTAIKTGDDCISIGPGTTNLWIERITCGPGHGISIGSLGKGYDEAGVMNVTVRSVVFSGTENGLRIKTWGRPSEGFVKGVVFEHALMQNVHNPIIIDQNYCPDDKGCPDQNSGVKISQVTYNDVQGSSATPVAVNFDCSATNPCSGIGLQDIKLTYGNKPAESSCKHADGSASGLVEPPSCLL